MSSMLIKVHNSYISPREITKIDIVPDKGVMVKDPRGRVLAWVGSELVGDDAVGSSDCLQYIAELFNEMRVNPRKAVQPDWGMLFSDIEIVEVVAPKRSRKKTVEEA